MKYSDRALREFVREGGFTCDHNSIYSECSECGNTTGDLAAELLAARRALRKAQKLVADAVRLGAIDQMYESRFGDVLSRALGSRPAAKAPAKKGKARRYGSHDRRKKDHRHAR